MSEAVKKVVLAYWAFVIFWKQKQQHQTKPRPSWPGATVSGWRYLPP